MGSEFFKGLMVLLLAFMLSATTTAQRVGETTTPSDIVIRKFAWQPYVNRADWDKGLYRTDNEAAQSDRNQRERQRHPTPRPDEVQTMPEVKSEVQGQGTNGFRYWLTIQNVGRKTIEAVEWAYVFFDTEDKQELARHIFVTRQKIKPNASKDLAQFSTSPPTGIVNAQTAKGVRAPLAERVEIVRLEYSDGSVWQRP